MGCVLCPRRCRADRAADAHGVCGAGAAVRVARAALHHWEEPPISARGGSGAIFFSYCPLRCVYCQNHEISQGGTGEDVSIEHLAHLMMGLKSRGAVNINLISAGHFAPEAAEAVRTARAAGLDLPVVWNTSGYESLRTLELIRDVADIFLPDFKYWSAETARRFSGAADYPAVASAAVHRMMELQPHCGFAPGGEMECGVVVRHLILPGHTKESKLILRHLRDQYGPKVYVSIMRQYTPPAAALPFEELNRMVRSAEYDSVVRYAEKIGLENVFLQGPGAAGAQYVPSFSSHLGGVT